MARHEREFFNETRETRPALVEWLELVRPSLRLLLPPAGIDAGQRVPQRVVVRRPPGVAGQRRIERDSLVRRLDESAGILIGTGQEQMEPGRRLGTETARRNPREQLDRPIRHALVQRKIRCQQIVSRRDLVGECLSGQFLHQGGCLVGSADVEKQRNGFQHQILGNRSRCVARQRGVFVSGLRKAALRNESERRRLRRALRLVARLLGLARRKSDRQGERCERDPRCTVRHGCSFAA